MKSKRIGIVVEYNPFHHGHQRQIDIIKQIHQDAEIVVVMSGHFTQRGEPTIVDKWSRTKHILDHGVDLVLELPFYYVVQSADQFAFGAISVLNQIGIDYLCFGSETGSIDYQHIQTHLHHQASLPIKDGISYVKHMNDLNLKPNDVLGYFYLDAINKINPSIKPMIIKRSNDYHDLALSTIASASAIRHGLKLGHDVSQATSMYSLLNTLNHVYLDDYFDLLKYILCTHSNDELNSTFLVTEGIENLLKKKIEQVHNMIDLIDACVSKRYTRARIQRTIVHLLTNHQKEHLSLDYLRVLGFNEKGQAILNKVKKQLDYPLVTAYKPGVSKMLDLELKATVVYDFVAQANLVHLEYHQLIVKKDH